MALNWPATAIVCGCQPYSRNGYGFAEDDFLFRPAQAQRRSMPAQSSNVWKTRRVLPEHRSVRRDARAKQRRAACIVDW